jgi:lipopolysaccharide export LptBFGC system permease protein LptF
LLKFQRALLVELLLTFFAVLAATTGVVFAGFALYLVTEGEGVASRFLVDLLPNLLPWSAAYSLPFAWVAAIAIHLRRMVAENEVTAIQTTGSHLRVLVLPIAAAGCLLAVAGTALNGWIVPEGQRAIKQGLRRELPVFLESLKDENRSVVLGNGRFSYGRFARGVFHEVELDQRDDEGVLLRKFVASEVRIRRVPHAGEADGGLEFHLKDAHVFDASLGGDLDHRRQGGETTIQTGRVERIGASTLFNEFFGTGRYLVRPKELTVSELAYAVARGGIWRGGPTELAVQLHGRLSLGASPLLLGLLAAGIALLIPARGGRVVDFVLCFLPPVLVFFGLHLAGPSLAQAGVPPSLALWSSNLVVGAGAAVVLALAFRR